MTLCDAKFKQDYLVTLVAASGSIRTRLNSIGFAKGSKVSIIDFTLHRQTYKVEVDGTKVAIRKEEAAKIQIGECE